MSLVGQFVFTNLLMNYVPLLWQAYCTINYEETSNKLYCRDCSWIRLRDLLAKRNYICGYLNSLGTAVEQFR